MTEAHYYNERIAHFPAGEGCLAALAACFPDCAHHRLVRAVEKPKALWSVCRNKRNSSLGEVTSREVEKKCREGIEE